MPHFIVLNQVEFLIIPYTDIITKAHREVRWLIYF